MANAVGQTAYFGSAAAARSVTVDSPRTVGMLAFDSASKYTIGGSTITLDGAVGQAAIYVAIGTHEINAPLAISDDTTITVAPVAATLTVTNLQDSTIALTKSGPGTLIVNHVPHAGINVQRRCCKSSFQWDGRRQRCWRTDHRWIDRCVARPWI